MSTSGYDYARPDHTAVQVYSTCPQSKDFTSQDYARKVIETAHWSEDAGLAGILIYTDNSIADPWIVAQLILQHTKRLLPLVAVQPLYIHPYAAAKMVASLGHVFGRRVALNMLAGGFKNDLLSFGDTLSHDERYERAAEYLSVVLLLLENPSATTFVGKFYSLRQAKIEPAIPPDLMPETMISGSSDAGLRVARQTGAIAMMYPAPAETQADAISDSSLRYGLRIGVIARQSNNEAWHDAHARFPDDRRGTIAHQLAMATSDSAWHKQLSEIDASDRHENGAYWLQPFRTYKSFCPYLVGSYDRVSDELTKYIRCGFRTFILDIPSSQAELEHARIAFEQAADKSRNMSS